MQKFPNHNSPKRWSSSDFKTAWSNPRSKHVLRATFEQPFFLDVVILWSHLGKWYVKVSFPFIISSIDYRDHGRNSNMTIEMELHRVSCNQSNGWWLDKSLQICKSTLPQRSCSYAARAARRCRFFKHHKKERSDENGRGGELGISGRSSSREEN